MKRVTTEINEIREALLANNQKNRSKSIATKTRGQSSATCKTAIAFKEKQLAEIQAEIAELEAETAMQ